MILQLSALSFPRRTVPQSRGTVIHEGGGSLPYPRRLLPSRRSPRTHSLGGESRRDCLGNGSRDTIQRLHSCGARFIWQGVRNITRLIKLRYIEDVTSLIKSKNNAFFAPLALELIAVRSSERRSHKLVSTRADI